MQKYLLLIGALVLLLSSACNRKANQQVTAASTPVAPPPPRTPQTAEEIEAKKKEFGPAERAPREYVEDEPMTQAAKATRDRYKTRQARVAETGVQEARVNYVQTGCLSGDCPTYTFKIMTDNTLRYEGLANVDLIGNFTGTLPFNPMTRINMLASRARFYNQKASATMVPQPDDEHSSITTSIDYLGWHNKVAHLEGEETKELTELEDYIRSLVDQANWTEVLPEEDK